MNNNINTNLTDFEFISSSTLRRQTKLTEFSMIYNPIMQIILTILREEERIEQELKQKETDA